MKRESGMAAFVPACVALAGVLSDAAGQGKAAGSSYVVPFEPAESRVWQADLVPCYAFHRSKWVEEPCYLKTEGRRVILGNGFLEAELATQPAFALVKLANKMTGKTWECPKEKSSPFLLKGAKGAGLSYAKVPEVNLTAKAGDFPKVAIEPGKNNSDDACSFTARLTGNPDLEVELEFRLRRIDHFFSSRLNVKNTTAAAMALLDIEGLSGGDIENWFLRWRLPLPGSRQVGDGYQPLKVGFLAKPGNSFQSEWLDAVLMPEFGPKEKKGLFQWTDKAKPWTEEYYDRISEIRKGVHPTVHYQGWYAKQVVSTDPSFVERGDKIIGIVGKMGGKTYHTRSWEYTLGERESPRYKKLLQLNKLTREKYGIGLSTGFGWDQQLGRDKYCVLGDKVREYLADQLSAFEERGGPQMWGIDFFSGFRHCDDSSHNHFPGEYSIYPQVRGLFMEWLPKFRREHDFVAVYSGPGFWGEPLTATISPHVDSQHQTDGTEGEWCDLHPDRMRADNAADNEGGFGQKSTPMSRVMGHLGHAGFRYDVCLHDLIGWRYALMRRAAVCPNFCFEFVAPDMPESEIAFTRSWVDWAGRNADTLYQRRNMVFGSKAPKIEGYSHIIRDRGFFALVNPGYAAQTVELNLASLEIPDGGLYAVEIFPERRDLNGGQPLDVRTPLRIELAPVTVMIFRTGPKDHVAQAQPGQGMPPVPKENYLRDWKAESDGNGTVFAASFQMFPSLKEFLPKRDTTTPEEKWKVEPTGFRKVYLIPWIEPRGGAGKRNTQDEVEDTVVSVEVNGKNLPVHQPQPRKMGVKFRCNVVDLGDALKPGENRVRIRVTSPRGNAGFRGAWLDWPQL